MNVERPVPVGVVGVGSMGRHHARVYSELQEAELVGVADDDEAAAREVAEEYDTEAVPTDDLFELSEAVSIAVPTEYHYDIAVDAMESGASVLVEKPFATSVEEGRAMLEVAEETGATVQVGHVERFNPAVVALSDIIPDLDIIAVQARRLGPPLDRDIGDGVALDLMIHDIDVMLSVVDARVTDVTAEGTRENQHVSAVVGFEDGVVGSLTASRLSQQRVRELTVNAESCTVDVDYVDRSVEIHRDSVPEYVDTEGSLRYRNESVIERPTVENGEPLKHELESFLGAVRNGSAPEVSGEDGIRALDVARTISRQAR